MGNLECRGGGGGRSICTGMPHRQVCSFGLLHFKMVGFHYDTV